MKILKIALVAASVLSLPAQADLLYGVYAEAGVAFQKTDSVSDAQQNSVVGERDSDVSPFLNIKLEHPVPLIPNFRFYLDSFDYSANSKDPVTSAVDFSSNEKVGTLYYEILDNYLSVDLGISVRQIETELSFAAAEQVVSDDYTIVIPTAYATAEFAIPTTSFALAVEYEGLSLDSNDYRLLKAYVSYELADLVAADLVFKLGVMSRDVRLTDLGGIDFNYNTDAVFSSVQVHF